MQISLQYKSYCVLKRKKLTVHGGRQAHEEVIAVMGEGQKGP
jgi:hypothetical protein